MYVYVFRHRVRVFIAVILLFTILWYINIDYTAVTNKVEPFEHPTGIASTLNGRPTDITFTSDVTETQPMRDNIFFFKIPRTGGSTVQNIIYRYTERFSLNVAVPITSDDKYNTMAYHIRYDPIIKSFQYPNTLTVTLLRHPTSLFPSIYHHYNLMASTGMNLKQLLASDKKPKITLNVDIANGGYNQMSHDLGFDLSYKSDKNAILQFINRTEEEFDFVMINEYMDASLVLLAHLMNWPLEYVQHLYNKSPTRYNFTDHQTLTILELNHVDALLYQHFLKKFRHLMRQYGMQKLDRQIASLQNLNKQFRQRCATLAPKRTTQSPLNEQTDDWECERAVKQQSAFEEILMSNQKKRITEQFWYDA